MCRAAGGQQGLWAQGRPDRSKLADPEAGDVEVYGEVGGCFFNGFEWSFKGFSMFFSGFECIFQVFNGFSKGFPWFSMGFG